MRSIGIYTNLAERYAQSTPLDVFNIDPWICGYGSRNLMKDNKKWREFVCSKQGMSTNGPGDDDKAPGAGISNPGISKI